MWRKRIDLKEQRERFVKNAVRSRERTMNRAVRLLAAKPRSVGELRERLLEKLWTNEAIVDDVIERLKEYKYLDDAQYARDSALSKLRQKPQGKKRLQQAMLQKHLDRETVENAIATAFEKYPEEEMIGQAIEKRTRQKGLPATRADEKKFFDHLMRLGFGYGIIKEKLNELRKQPVPISKKFTDS